MWRARIVLVAVVGGAFLLITRDRVYVWQNERRLWTEAIEAAPNKPRPWVNLGRQWALDGNRALAADSYETAIRLAQRPDRSRDEQVLGRAIAEANLALVKFQEGDRGAALNLLASARVLVPTNPNIEALERWMRRQPDD